MIYGIEVFNHSEKKPLLRKTINDSEYKSLIDLTKIEQIDRFSYLFSQTSQVKKTSGIFTWFLNSFFALFSDLYNLKANNSRYEKIRKRPLKLYNFLKNHNIAKKNYKNSILRLHFYELDSRKDDYLSKIRYYQIGFIENYNRLVVSLKEQCFKNMKIYTIYKNLLSRYYINT